MGGQFPSEGLDNNQACGVNITTEFRFAPALLVGHIARGANDGADTGLTLGINLGACQFFHSAEVDQNNFSVLFPPNQVCGFNIPVNHVLAMDKTERFEDTF